MIKSDSSSLTETMKEMDPQLLDTLKQLLLTLNSLVIQQEETKKVVKQKHEKLIVSIQDLYNSKEYISDDMFEVFDSEMRIEDPTWFRIHINPSVDLSWYLGTYIENQSEEQVERISSLLNKARVTIKANELLEHVSKLEIPPSCAHLFNSGIKNESLKNRILEIQKGFEKKHHTTLMNIRRSDLKELIENTKSIEELEDIHKMIALF